MIEYGISIDLHEVIHADGDASALKQANEMIKAGSYTVIIVDRTELGDEHDGT